MKVIFNEETKVLQVVTDITKEVAEAGVTQLVAKDDKGNELYKFSTSKHGNAAIGEFGMVCNTYVNGCAAIVMVLPADETKDTVKKIYGKSLVTARKYNDIVTAQAAAEIETINSLFDEE